MYEKYHFFGPPCISTIGRWIGIGLPHPFESNLTPAFDMCYQILPTYLLTYFSYQPNGRNDLTMIPLCEGLQKESLFPIWLGPPSAQCINHSSLTIVKERQPAMFNRTVITCLLPSYCTNRQRNHACKRRRAMQAWRQSALRVADRSTNAARNTMLPYYIRHDASTCH